MCCTAATPSVGDFIARSKPILRPSIDTAPASSGTRPGRWQRENDKVRVAAEGEARTKQERENVDVRIREMHAKAKEDYKARIDSIQTALSSVGSGLNALVTDKDKLMWTVGKTPQTKRQ